MKFPHHPVLVAILAVVLVASTAHADLFEGQQMVLEEAYPTQKIINDTWGPFTVGPNPQVVVNSIPGLINCTINVSDHDMTIQYPQANLAATGAFNGFILTQYSTPMPPFTMALVDPSTTVAGFDQSRVTFDATHVYINESGLRFQAGQNITVDFATVPEPSSLVLLGIAAVGLSGFAWRSRLKFAK